MTKVLILTNSQDIHTDLVLRELHRRSVPVIRLHTDEFPTDVKMTYFNDDVTITIRSSGKRFLASEITSVWYRRPKKPVIIPEVMDISHRNFASAESKHMLENMYSLLKGAFWVNPLLAGREAQNKLLQMRVAKRCGLIMPDTIITNDPRAAHEFIKYHNGCVVYKAVRTGLVPQQDGSSRLIFTSKLTASDLANLECVAIAPCIFQEYVEKRLEIRATVIGEQVISCAIYSQENESTKTDWRAGRARYEPFQLPVYIENQLRSMMHELGLRYGAFDFILTPKDEYVMLEVNPNGQWAFVQGLTQQPIAQAIALLLTEGEKK